MTRAWCLLRPQPCHIYARCGAASVWCSAIHAGFQIYRAAKRDFVLHGNVWGTGFSSPADVSFFLLSALGCGPLAKHLCRRRQHVVPTELHRPAAALH
eukprot:scaffold332728_cov18-Prasinocladus_malaysianus.AAC.1